MSDSPPAFASEAERLQVLQAIGLLDSNPEPAYDDLARLAAELWEAPIALVCLVDEKRQWFKAACGMELRETPREHSFCAHNLESTEPLVVPDATLDPRFADNPFVRDGPRIRFYAGAPVGPAPGVTLGTLCVVDFKPRNPTAQQLERLRLLARQVSNEMRLRLAARTEHSLRALESRLRQQAESLPFIVWTARTDGVVDYSNHQFLDYTGTSPEADPGSRWQACVHPEDLPVCLAQWQAALRDERPYLTRMRLRRRDGAYRWFQMQAAPIRDTESRLALWYGIGVDVEDQRRLEAEASRLSRRLVATMEAVGDGIFTVDTNWRFTYFNAVAERITHRARSELLGRSLWDEFPDLLESNFELHYRRAATERVPVTFEEFYPPLNAWYEVRAFPAEDGLAIYFRDITERRETERRLRQQAELLDQAHDAILVRDLEHTIRFWNQGARRLYGWTQEEATGRSAETLLYREPSEFRAAHRATLQLGEWTGRLRQITRDGRDITVDARWTLIRTDAGAPRAIFVINTDVTERLKLEQQFLRAQRMESIGTLAGGIAHDLNNLLAPIVMGTDLLRQLAPDPRVEQVLDNIARSARRGGELVKQVLSFARGVEGARVGVSLHHLTRELEGIVANTFPRDIRFELHVESDLWLITGDPTQLHQVLLNLCVNARDAMPDGGRLALTARNTRLDEHYAVLNRGAASGRYVVIEVSDDGVGMSPEVQSRVFEPFFTTKPPGAGTGLGLSTALGIVRSHGGFVNVYSEPGKGSVFKIYLPAQTEAPPPETGATPPPTLPRGRGECVLVVDDEQAILTITRQTLETFGYRVLTAEDGAQAVGIYATRRTEIALVLTDMMMPVMDGPALIQALRRLEPAVRIIAASGLHANGSVAKATSAGVRHFLSKPYSAERLLTVLRDALDEPSR